MSSELAIEFWPQLRDAVQPAPLARRNGSWKFNVADEWAQLVQRVERGEYRLRAPAATKAGLAWFRGHGTCLVPLLHEDEIWIDPQCEPQDGDIVIVELGERTREALLERWRRDPAVYAKNVAIYGENPGRLATKWLRVIGNDYWLVTNESMFTLAPHPTFAPDGSRVLGVVRYVERRGVSIYGSGAPIAAHCISPNAARATYQAIDVGPIDFTTVNPGTPVDGGTVVSVTFTPSVDCDITVRCSYEAEMIGSTGGSFTLLTRAFRRETANPVVTLLEGDFMNPTNTRTAQTVQYQFSASERVQYDFGLNGYITTPDGTDRTLRFHNAMLIVAELKR
jgi:hypothetical protein